MSSLFIGLMSGTSLDGVDAVAASFDNGGVRIHGEAFVPYPAAIRQQILSLQAIGDNELDRSARLGNALSHLYADAVQQLCQQHNLTATHVNAIVCHGQTIRHAPQAGYTLQIGNHALLAELTGMDVIGDLRSRDVAAGGQGAPLVPAFHQAVFADPQQPRAILNIGGIANLTRLDPTLPVIGFDTGPGNMLLDAWIRHHRNAEYDANGDWARSGTVLPPLLTRLLAEPYFRQPLPKSTGRDLFDLGWLAQHLDSYQHLHGQPAPADVQATLLALTAHSIADAVRVHAANVQAIYVCGGGARNGWLMQALVQALPGITLATTAELGLPVHQVEAAAFAWLGHCFRQRRCANLPDVTGSRGPRLLGALYPA